MDWAVNFATQRPGGSGLLAVVGDDPATLLLDAKTGNRVHTLEGHLDYSFAAAWHPSGSCWPQATRQGKAQHQPAGQCALPTERRHLHHLSTCSGTVHWLQVYLSGEAVSALLVGTP